MWYSAAPPGQPQAHPDQTLPRSAVPETRNQTRLEGLSGSAPARLTRSGQLALLLSLLMGAVTHGYHLFLYPLYLTDEGIYMQQSWSLLREGQLSPYTYFYDHAPAGWMVISVWASVLPFQFQTFGTAINTGRVLMLLIHLASVFLLFQVTRRLSKSVLAAFIATFLFNCSPLAIFYQREVLLDNLMVFWMLLSLTLVTRNDGRLVTLMLSGLAFGVGVLTKENAIFFAPVLGYLLYSQVRKHNNYRFALGSWSYATCASISIYFLYATLKNELWPSHLNFDLNNPPADHVSLLYSIWWQLHRSQGSILDLHSYFWVILNIWLAKDGFILVAGIGALFVNLLIGIQNRRHQGYLIAALLAASYAFYIARGSDMLEFYIVPLIPFLAMNLGMLGAFLVRPLSRARPKAVPIITQGVVVLALFAALLSPLGGYVLVRDEFGKIVPHDLYKLSLTTMQTEQIAFIRRNIPPDARIIMDDELWVELHDVPPYYKWAHSHWKASADPDVRDKLFARDWHNIDYLVLSNKMVDAMQRNNGDGRENWILEGLQHAQRIWDLHRGDIELQIYQVEK